MNKHWQKISAVVLVMILGFIPAVYAAPLTAEEAHEVKDSIQRRIREKIC